jgi:hypothetical protein
MGAPLGNKFWKMRAKHGRDKIFSHPGELWDACAEYFEWVDNNPYKVQEPIKSGEFAKEIIELDQPLPYTLGGLCIFLGVSHSYWKDFRATNKNDKGFSAIIAQVEEIIYHQKFSGAAAGQFNANIISRDLGLKDRSDVTTNDKDIQTGPDLSGLTYEQLQQLTGSGQSSDSGTNPQSGPDGISPA